MRRRSIMAGLAAAAAAWPGAGRGQGQRPLVPVVGFLGTTSADEAAALEASFRLGLNEAAYTPGETVAIEYRWAEGRYDRLPALAADLVSRRVAVIAATGSPLSALASQAATSTIPIVFANGGDPVALGLVASLSRPEGNTTGVTFLNNTLSIKRLELLYELVPHAASVAMLVNPDNPTFRSELRFTLEAASARGWQLQVLHASNAAQVEEAFATAVRENAAALLVAPDGFLDNQRRRLVALAAAHRLPAAYSWPEYAAAGGLISYGAKRADAYRQAGAYVGLILRGSAPADLPVLQPTHFELVVNLSTARALGLTIPQSILLRADEVIE
jgi:putative ABC transport system substrate-binding protein